MSTNQVATEEPCGAGLRVQAQALRGALALPAVPGFDVIPAGAAPVLPRRAPDGGPLWQAEDVKRAVAAARAAGIAAYSIEIAPDGTITLLVTAPSTAGA